MPVIALRRQRLPGLPGLLLLLLACGIGTGARADTAERVYAAQVPGERVRVLVVLTSARWPAGGMRIEDGKGAVLAAHVEPDLQAAALLDAAGQRALQAQQHLAAMSEANAKTANAILALRLVSDWTFARAAGAAVELPPGTHPQSLRVVLLDASGQATTTLAPVPVRKDAGPPAPAGLRAQAAPSGITLQWQTAAQADGVPAYAYEVERNAGTEHESLTLHPQLMTMGKPGQALPFVDRTPPVEATLSYELRLVDVLGVGSAPASVQVYSPDFEAGTPPGGQNAKAERGLVTVTWTPVANPRTSALVVERAQLVKGPYELVTPEGLNAQSARFEDRHILPGAGYYYRVRAVMPNGSLGPAADPVYAQPLSASALPAPEGLAAEVGVNQVSLIWKPVPGTGLAGYIVERRASASAPRWARLNTRLAPGPRYVDATGPSPGGSFEYRVTAVATDEGTSAPSQVLQVQLVDSVPPPVPIVVSSSGEDGRVQIHFAVSEPADKTAQVALLRSDSPAEDGLVVGAPVPVADAAIVDDWVHAGQAYWYRLVAFDKAGNRSAESAAFEVHVGAVNLPTPKAPVVAYSAQPVPQAKLTFDAPPPHVRVIVQVQGEDGRWRQVIGPMVGASATDLEPPGPNARYRIVYVGENGGAGVPSPTSAPP